MARKTKRDHPAEWKARPPREEWEKAWGRARNRALTRLATQHQFDFEILLAAELGQEPAWLEHEKARVAGLVVVDTEGEQRDG